MPTKKGKSKPAKARKTSTKSRRTRAAGGKGQSKRAGAARKTGSPRNSGGRKKPAGRLRRTEAGPVWIGSSPEPVISPTDEPGNKKATDGGGSDRVVIL
jgi:hypothetical protein